MKTSKEHKTGKCIHTIITLALIISCLESCASITPVTISIRPGSKPVSMNANINREYTMVKHFRVKQKVPVLFVFRLSPYGAAADINEMIAPELQSSQADAIVNLSVKGNAEIQDVFLPIGIGLLGGLILSPTFFFITVIPFYEDLKTYEVEGDLVKYVAQATSPENPKEPFDPLTGLPKQKPKIEYDPETGLPKKQ